MFITPMWHGCVTVGRRRRCRQPEGINGAKTTRKRPKADAKRCPQSMMSTVNDVHSQLYPDPALQPERHPLADRRARSAEQLAAEPTVVPAPQQRERLRALPEDGYRA